MRRRTLGCVLCAGGCAAASAVYQTFGHGVTSRAMTWAFLVPLLGGAVHLWAWGIARGRSVFPALARPWQNLLIRRSLEKPVYKEKLRLRSYGVPGDGDNVFLEMKKKVQGVVYKRRICLPLDRAMACLAQGTVPAAGGQIGREIAYMLRRYRLRPAVLLAYDRTAYTELEPSPNRLRITIDRDIRSRQTDLDLRLGAAGESLLAPGMRLMEIKTAHAIPLWLCAALDQNEIRPTSFSKYGRVYEARMRAGQARAMRPAAVKGGVCDAVCHV